MQKNIYALFLAALFQASGALAATVTSTADSGAGSLREAIATAPPGATIDFAVTGTISLTNGALLINKDLMISGPGATNLVVQRSTSAGTPDFRVFSINSGIVSISGLTVSNGRGVTGGGINNETTLSLRDCTIINNSAIENGGGINNLSTVTMSNCVIAGNAVLGGATGGVGGGVDNSGTTTAIGCIISSNSVNGGAAAGFAGGLNNTGTLSLTNCSVSANSVVGGAEAEAGGGGIFNQGTLSIETTTIAGNLAQGGAGASGGPAEGGGIANDLGTITLNRSTVSDNVAAGGNGASGIGGLGQGGGIANSLGTILIESSTVSGNAALPGTGTPAGIAEGGGIFNAVGSLTLAHSTITTNQGAGFFNEDGVLDIKNTILAGNVGPFDLVTTVAADIHSAGFNLLGTADKPLIAGPNDQFNVSGETARLGPLRNNGGPTFTHALLCGSPAIDAGDGAGAPATDQRGFPRIVNATIDIGAFEFNNAVPTITCPTPATNCTSTAGAIVAVSVTVSDPDNDPLTVVWVVDGFPVDIKQLPAGSTNATATLSLTAGAHQISATVVDSSDCIAVCSTTNTVVARGDLYPIALSQQNLVGVPIGGIIHDIYNGVQPGNFGWLTWAGSPNEPTLALSLTPPGNSSTYINPRNPKDHVVSIGDWVQGKPGVSNSGKVRTALNQLKQIDITVPVWDQAVSRGNNSLYRVVAFAKVRIVDYRLPQQNRISARFLGLVPCD